MDKEIIAIAFSDFHLALWNQLNEGYRRTKNQLEFLEKITNRASKLRVPILFSGDFMHNPKGIENELLTMIGNSIRKLPKCKIYCIPGNHDQSEVNYRDKKSPNYIDWLCTQSDNFVDISYKTIQTKNFYISGIPYIKNNRDYPNIVKDIRSNLKKDLPNILLIHTNLAGAKEPNGSEIDDTQNITRELHKYFKGFNLVLSGHIHRHQKLASNVWMVGATSQQRTSDMGCKMGYIEIYEDLSIRFINSRQPEYIYKNPNEENPDNYNLYIDTLVKSIKNESDIEGKFSKDLKPFVLGKRYLKVNGVKDKSKIRFLTKILKQA